MARGIGLAALLSLLGCEAPEPCGDACADEFPRQWANSKSKKDAGARGNDDRAASPSPGEPVPDLEAPVPGEVLAPSDLKAYVGGASVALRWNELGYAGPDLAEFRVVRDGAVIATVKPGFHQDFPELYGHSVIDARVEPAKTYSYRVEAVTTKGEKGTSAPISVTTPASFAAPPAMTIDTSAATDQTTYMESMVRPFLQIWYPKMAQILAVPSYQPPAAFELIIDPTYDGVAYASGGDRIVMAAKFARETCPTTGDRCLGAWLHEATHIVQWGTTLPGWMVEGTADWAREFVLHDRHTYPIRPSQSYTQGYTQGAYFMEWIAGKYTKDLVRRMSITYRGGTAWNDSAFADMTGKTLDQLWTELRAETQRGPAAIKVGNECLDGVAATRAIGLSACGGDASQKWTVVRAMDGSMNLVVDDDTCLDVQYSGKADGTGVWAWPCNGGNAQRWRLTTDGKLRNPNSGKCLAGSGSSLVIRSCSEALSVDLPK
jgi:hypothetical protein